MKKKSVVIRVQGGMVQDVYSDVEDLEVDILDEDIEDNMAEEEIEKHMEYKKKLEEKIKELDECVYPVI